MMSPSCTMYSLPSSRTSPWSRHAAIEPRAISAIVADDLGADEAARDVAVDLAGRQLRRRAARNRPGAALVLADGEERNVAEQIVAGADHAIEARLRQTEVGEKRRRVRRPRAARSRARSSRRRRRPRSPARDRNGVRPAASAARVDVAAPSPPASCDFVEVDDDQQRLRRQELKPAQPLEILALEIERAQRPALLERRPAEREHVALAFELGGAALLQILLEPLEPALGDAEVREDQLVFHRLRVARRIDRARRVRHGRILERAQHVDERVGVLVGDDVDERLRAGRLPGGRQVGELDGRRHALPRVEHRREPVEPRVGHFRDADERLALAVRRARRFRGAGHELEERGLAAGTEADEGCPKHEMESVRIVARGVRRTVRQCGPVDALVRGRPCSQTGAMKRRKFGVTY